AVAPAAEQRYLVYFGTYTGGKSASKGIYVARFDGATGQLGEPQLAAEITNPSFLAIHPNRRFLYAVGETGGKQGGTVSAFAVDRATGRLSLLNQASSRGGGPCHVTVDKTGQWVLTVNYGTGSVTVLAIRPDGSLGESTAFVQHAGSSVNPKRQEGPHAHSVNLSPDNRFAIVADLGLDQVLVYRFDAAKGTLQPNDPPFARVAPGSGPRHFTFHPSGRFAYVINELASTITAFNWDAGRGALSEIQTLSTLPQDFSGENYTAEVVAHPNGRFLYGSNRGHDSIALFSIDRQGKLAFVETTPTRGSFPRNFALDPTGRWLLVANQRSDNVVLFRVDPKTGKLSSADRMVHVGAPVCVRFLPLD
ncbi:MAG: lactonase family protein, partial [Bryobacteraceae bacterium]